MTNQILRKVDLLIHRNNKFRVQLYVTELGIAEDKTAQVKNAWSNDETRELILYSQAHPLEDEDL
jgi:hypothetical protein